MDVCVISTILLHVILSHGSSKHLYARFGSDFGLNTVTKPKQTLPDRCHDGAAASNVFLQDGQRMSFGSL